LALQFCRPKSSKINGDTKNTRRTQNVWKTKNKLNPVCTVSFINDQYPHERRIVMFNRSIVALALVVGLAVSSAPRGLQEQHPDFAELEKVLLEELKETNTPGATVAIVSGDRVIYSKAFGI